MSAHFKNAKSVSFPPQRKFDVLFCCPHPLSHRGWRELLAVLHVMFNLVEDPRIANSSASNHNAIDAILVFIFDSLFGGINIPVTEYWNMHPRVFFDLGNQTPVSRSLIHLNAR